MQSTVVECMARMSNTATPAWRMATHTPALKQGDGCTMAAKHTQPHVHRPACTSAKSMTDQRRHLSAKRHIHAN